MKLNLLLLFVCLLGLELSSLAQIRSYRRLPDDPVIGVSLSNKWTVGVQSCKGAFEPVYTHAFLPNDDQVTKIEHLAMFGFDPSPGPATIRITRKDGTVLSSSNAGLMNKTYEGVSVSYEAGAILIEVCQPMKQLSVRMTSDKANPLVIHADPYDDPPIPANAQVVTFDGGTDGKIHEQTAPYDRYSVPNNIDVIVIEDGALFKGTIHTASGRNKPLRIQGRGVIICRERSKPADNVKMQYNQLELNQGDNHRITGITLMNGRHFAARVSDNAYVQNVKFYGYRNNNDGIVAGDNSQIVNCFFKVNDDHIKLYNPGMQVRNCVFYHQKNGAIFQMAWNKINPGNNCLVEYIEVIESEAGCGDPALNQGGIARSFINHRESEENGKVCANTTFRKVYIGGQMDRFICLNGYSFSPITYDNLQLQDITLENPPNKVNWLYADNGNNTNTSIEIFFTNVRFGDRYIQQSDFKTLGTVNLSFDSTGTAYQGNMNQGEAACQSCDATPIEPEQGHSIKLYPNPASGKLFFQTEGIKLEAATLTNTIGQAVYQLEPKEQYFSLDSIPAGIYNISLQLQDGSIYQQKVVVR
ncbi:MAG: T9SS type A sorting domain-containing protein [Bacteroidota bacterium]